MEPRLRLTCHAASALGLLLTLVGCQSTRSSSRTTDAPAERTDTGGAAAVQPGSTTSEGAQAGDESGMADPQPTKVVNLKGLEFDVPANWVETPLSSSSRVAQYRLGEDADLVIYYFGPSGAGDIEANVQRWLGEYTEVLESTKVSALKRKLFLTIVRIAGTYSPRSMAPEGQRTEPKPNTHTFAAIISGGPEGPLYMKAVGPIETVNQHAEGISRFLDSVRPASADGDRRGGN